MHKQWSDPKMGQHAGIGQQPTPLCTIIATVETDFGQSDSGHRDPTDFGQSDLGQSDFGQTNFGQRHTFRCM